MATFDVALRSDRWQELFTGAGTVDARGRAIRLAILASGAPTDANPGASIEIGGNSDSDDNRYAYDGVETVFGRLSVDSDEAHTVTVLQDGTTTVGIRPFLPDIALATDADTNATGAAGALFAKLESQNACTITAIAGGTVGSALNLAGGGALTVAANGSFTFDPDGDFDTLKGDAKAVTGPATITVTDGTNSETTTANILITVSGVNDGPTAGAKVATPDVDGTATGNLITDDAGANTAASHPQAEPMTVSKINGKPFSGGLFLPLPSGAKILVNGITGAYTYDAAGSGLEDTDTDTIAFTLRDRFGAEDTASLVVTITAA